MQRSVRHSALLSTNCRFAFAKPRSFLASARKQCIFGLSESRFPHLRVMGRNIRFLKSELEPFRAQFKQEVGNGKTQQT